jgi:hypothetical protein
MKITLFWIKYIGMYKLNNFYNGKKCYQNTKMKLFKYIRVISIDMKFKSIEMNQCI